MSRYTLTRGLGRRLEDTVSGDFVFIPPAKANDFDEAYHDLMFAYHDEEATVLAILWENYRPHEQADVIHYQ